MPLVKVLNGQPTPEELAAVIAVVQARAITTAAGPGPPPRKPPVSAWTDRAAAIALRRLALPRLINLTTTTPSAKTGRRPR